MNKFLKKIYVSIHPSSFLYGGYITETIVQKKSMLLGLKLNWISFP